MGSDDPGTVGGAGGSGVHHQVVDDALMHLQCLQTSHPAHPVRPVALPCSGDLRVATDPYPYHRKAGHGCRQPLLRRSARGGSEQLVYEQAPVPVPGPGEARVEVHAAAITFAELNWDLTWTTRDGRDRTPVIPSHEVSGVVAGLGEDVHGLSAGQEVYGLIPFDRNGAAADYVTVPAADLADRPRSVSHVQAASLPLAALTAWQALSDHAGALACGACLAGLIAYAAARIPAQLAVLGGLIAAAAAGEAIVRLRGRPAHPATPAGGLPADRHIAR
jgi:Alcohol dehydrogenase GroES-like domain